MNNKFAFNKKVAMLLIQIIVIAVTLVLAVGTYAWYTSQTTAKVTETTVTAAPGANTTLLDVTEEENPHPYSGQTGTGGEGFPGNILDVPYTRTVTVKVKFEPTQADPYLVIRLNSMVVTLSDGVTQYASANDPRILEQFTWRAYACTLTGDPESPTRSEEVALVPETEMRTLSYPQDGEMAETTIAVKTGYALYVPDPSQPEVKEKYPVLADTVTEIRIELIFLDELSYLARLDYEEYLADNNESYRDRYENITEFRYCGYENMRAVFGCTIEIGFDY